MELIVLCAVLTEVLEMFPALAECHVTVIGGGNGWVLRDVV